MFDRIKPKVALILAGCYGSSSALITAAKRRGIVTAEYQHGVISAGHDGYNFAPVLVESPDFRATLPEHFLSFGTWWNGLINAPVAMTALGNPHRSFNIQRLIPHDQAHREKDQILILSDGFEFDIYLALARQLQPQARKLGMRVVIRPHPLERQSVVNQHGSAIDLIEIDSNESLYTSLLSARAVVSELSTGMFEAVGLADKLFVWDTPKSRFCFPKFPFRPFTSAHDLIEMLADEQVGRLPASQIDAIWAPDWQQRYGEFLRRCGVEQGENGGRLCINI